MNCHEENKGKQEHQNHSPFKHILHMAVCCGLPIIIIGALPFISKLSPETGGILGKIAPFLCPIMMIAMLPMMFRDSKKGSCCDNIKAGNENSNPSL